MPNTMDKTAIQNSETYQARTKILKALAHPSRLLMIDALVDGEKCVCELQRLVGSDISTVSKHLSLLKAAGIVLDRKEGLQVYYRLRVPCIQRFFDCVDTVLADNPEQCSCKSTE